MILYDFRRGCLQYKYYDETISNFPTHMCTSYLSLYFYYSIEEKGGKSMITREKTIRPQVLINQAPIQS